MKIYVINLRKNHERMSRIKRRLDDLGIPFERVEAVYGRELSEKEKHSKVSCFKWWCARGTLPRDGEIGCALSHIKVYKNLIDSGEGCCCVLEDDDTLKDGLEEQLLRVERWIDPSKSQVVLLTNYSNDADDGSWRIVSTQGDSSTEAYVITRKAACNIIEKNYPVCMPSDSWYFWVSRGWIELYHAYPTMVPPTWQLPGYVSDVCPKDEKILRVSDMGLIRKTVWKVGRIIGRFMSSIVIGVLCLAKNR